MSLFGGLASAFAPAQPNACAHLRPGAFYYPLPSGRTCCSANSVGLDPTGWSARRSTAPLSTAPYAMRFSLSIKNVFANNAMRTLQWRHLSPMHGRRVHIAAVTHTIYATLGMSTSNEPSIAADATVFSMRLRLPSAGTSYRVRLLFNYGILSDDVDLCVDETSSHVDPGPPGSKQQLVVEGHATSELITLGAGSSSSSSGGEALFGASNAVLGLSRTLTPLPLDGPGDDEIADAHDISRSLECANAAAWRGLLERLPIDWRAMGLITTLPYTPGIHRHAGAFKRTAL